MLENFETCYGSCFKRQQQHRQTKTKDFELYSLNERTDTTKAPP